MSLVFLFKSQSVLLDSVPQLGHIPRILKAMSARNNAFPKYALQITHQLSTSEVSFNISNVYLAIEDISVCVSLIGRSVLEVWQVKRV